MKHMYGFTLEIVKNNLIESSGPIIMKAAFKLSTSN